MDVADMKIKIDTQLNKAVDDVIKLDKSLYQLNERLKQLKSGDFLFHEKDLTKIRAYNKEVQDIEAEIKKLSNTGKAGFDDMGNAIGKNNNGFTKAYSSLSRIANILPGIGVGGLIAFATGPIMNYIESLTKGSAAAQKMKKDNDEFKESLKQAESSAMSTGIQLKAYVDIARDSTKPLTDRNFALREANKLLGDHGEKLTLVNINTKDVTKEVENFTNALIAQAVAAKYSDRIADLMISKTEKSKAYGKALNEYNAAVQANTNTEKQYAGSLDKTNLALSKQIYLNPAIAEAYAKKKTAAEDYRLTADALIETTNNFNTSIAESVSAFGQIGIHSKKAAKDVETVSDVIAKMERQLEHIGKNDPFNLNADVAKAKIAEIESTIKKLIDKFKLTANSPLIINLDARIDIVKMTQRINKQLKDDMNLPFQLPFEIIFENSPTNEAVIERAKKELQRFGSGPAVRTDTADTPGAFSGQFLPDAKEAYQRGYLVGHGYKKGLADGLSGAGLDKAFEEVKKKFNDLQKDLNNIIGNTFASGISGAIETIMNGGSIGDLFGGLFQVLGEGLKQFGKALLAYGISLKVFQDAFKKPGLAIAAGIGLIALGSLMAASVQKNVPKLAQGGIVPAGYPGDTYPALLSSGEAVVPAHKLPDLKGGGGGPQTIQLVGQVVLRGKDAYIMFNQEVDRRNRI